MARRRTSATALRELNSPFVFFLLQARRALRALRGLVRLKLLIQGQSVKRQATTTLRCMQTLARVQSQIRARRIRMSEENQALQRQLQQKTEKELEKLRASVSASSLRRMSESNAIEQFFCVCVFWFVFYE